MMMFYRVKFANISAFH